MPRVTSTCGNCTADKSDLSSYYCDRCSGSLQTFEAGWDERAEAEKLGITDYRAEKERVLQSLQRHPREFDLRSTFDRPGPEFIDPGNAGRRDLPHGLHIDTPFDR